MLYSLITCLIAASASLIIDDADELRGRSFDMVDGPRVQMLFGRLLRHIVIVTASGTKQLRRAGHACPRFCYH